MDSCRMFKWRKHTGDRVGLFHARHGYFGSSATLLGHHLWVIGGNFGAQSFFVLDLNRKEWESILLSGEQTASFVLHTANLYEDRIYLFGVSTVRGTGETDMDELFVLDPTLKELEIMPTYGGDERPCYNRGHTAEVCESLNVLALFGTPNRPGGTAWGFNKLWLLDLGTNRWRTGKSKGEIPSRRKRHASCIVGTVLFIYNGQYRSGLNDFFMVDLSRKNYLVWHKLELSGREEHGRVCAGIAYVGSGRLLIFGGYANHQNTNDLLVIENIFSPERRCRKVVPYDISSSPSAVVEAYVYSGIPPSEREAPRLVRAHDKVYVVGGNAPDEENYYELSPVALDGRS